MINLSNFNVINQNVDMQFYIDKLIGKNNKYNVELYELIEMKLSDNLEKLYIEFDYVIMGLIDEDFEYDLDSYYVKGDLDYNVKLNCKKTFTLKGDPNGGTDIIDEETEIKILDVEPYEGQFMSYNINQLLDINNAYDISGNEEEIILALEELNGAYDQIMNEYVKNFNVTKDMSLTFSGNGYYSNI